MILFRVGCCILILALELVSIDRLGVIMEVTRKGDVSNICIHD